MRTLRVIAPVLAVVILLAMTGSPSVLRGALATRDALPEGAGATAQADGETAESDTARTGAYTVDGAAKSSDGEVISSSAAGQSAVLVRRGGSLTMTNATITKSGDAKDAGSPDLPGLNAAFVASGSAATLWDSAVTTAGEGADAVFSTGAGASVDLSNVTLSTTGGDARGIVAASGGNVSARNVEISTTGSRGAAVVSERGDGAVTLDAATIAVSGEGGPLLYSEGAITAKNLNGTATSGPMLVIEGDGTIALSDSNLTGAGPNGVMLYRSAPNDSEGAACLTATNSVLTTTSEGPFFYVTNARAEAALSGSTLTYPSGILAQVSGDTLNNWGIPGENGGDFTLTGAGQVLSGDVVVDSLSAFHLKLTSGSIYTGAVDGSNVGRSVAVSLDEASSWTLTADSHVDALTDAKENLSNIQSGGFLLFYDASSPENAWLKGQTQPLSGGGSLLPEPENG